MAPFDTQQQAGRALSPGRDGDQAVAFVLVAILPDPELPLIQLRVS